MIFVNQQLFNYNKGVPLALAMLNCWCAPLYCFTSSSQLSQLVRNVELILGRHFTIIQHWCTRLTAGPDYIRVFHFLVAH